MSETKGIDNFLKSSDNFFKKIAIFLDSYTVEAASVEKLSEIREVCEIVKVTAMTIKTLRDDNKSPKSPAEKIKAKSNGQQISV